MNHLYYGDNLTRMRQMQKSSVDLIYLDPPFNSKRNYNLMYKTMTGNPVPEQAEAFCDTWEMDDIKQELADKMPILLREYGVDDYYIEFWRLWIKALRNTQPHLLAYLIYMVQRLLHMRLILKSTGSIYLHCDSTASHYIKVMMDGIFGHQNYRNEIIWKRADTVKGNVGQGSKRFDANTDTLLFYSKTPGKNTFNPQYAKYNEDTINDFYKYVEPDTGRRYQLISMTAPGEAAKGNPFYEVMGVSRYWRYSREKMKELIDAGMVVQTAPGNVPRKKQYLDIGKGVPVQSLWTDVAALHSKSTERLGYPTQKPIALLDRIIKTSSNEGDVVFDPFCGCGTTIYSAEKNNREWIGCDIAILSIQLVSGELTKRYHLTEGVDFEVKGIPTSVEGAELLFKSDPFQFQNWAIERVGGFPTQRRSNDKGVDGRLYFETRSGLKDMVLSVKGGHVRPTDVRDLRGVLERESNAELAGFISLKEPTKAMRDEARDAGSFDYAGLAYPRIQFLTISEILEGKREFHTPTKMGSRIAGSKQGNLAYDGAVAL